MARRDRFFVNRDIRFLDTTLRDGEQTPGVSLSTEDKLLIAHKLDTLGVNIIEAGSAITSEGEREAIRAVANEGLNAEVCSFCRMRNEDIDLALECNVDSIHLVVPVSDLHIRTKLKKTHEEVLQIVEDTVKYAKDKGLVVELSGEDASRADLGFLKEVYAAGIEAGADRICFCDTVGQLTPKKSSEIFKKLASIFDVPIAVHCHNDFGMATANTIAALEAGASEAHVTVNAIGERAGNASLEEVVMAIETLYDHKTGIACEELYKLSRTVSRLSGIEIASNKAIVGGHAFAHEAGIHTQGLLANAKTYEPFPPKKVGREHTIVLGKHTGRSSVMLVLRELGLDATDNQINEIVRRIKKIGDVGKVITDADFEVIAETVLSLATRKARIELIGATIVSGKDVTPTSSIRLKVDGNEILEAGTGDGPVDAAFSAISSCLSGFAGFSDIKLEDYHVDAITGGTNSLVNVQVEFSKNGKTISAQSAGTDIFMESVKAILESINRLVK